MRKQTANLLNSLEPHELDPLMNLLAIVFRSRGTKYDVIVL
jgi:hypothetical protein